ncbi:hypothetical protein GQ44DRAFT_623894 [Phaeosphaeriaceae sp. PMI808]|nr:hypothetical protein GQ44DRAFT_623894 [Phaeosphaeriaceae sp. PMI808]
MSSTLASIASPSSASPSSTSSGHTSDHVPSQRKSRVTAEHTLNRVRENQRRHRARQRDHVATLEARLTETKQLLAEARAEIVTLKAQQAESSMLCRNNHVIQEEIDGLNKHLDSELATLATSSGPQFQYLDNPDLTFLGDANSSTFIIDINSLQVPPPFPSPAPEDLDSPFAGGGGGGGGPPPCCEDATSVSTQQLNEPADPECSTCKTKPPPDPEESTTLCAQAFVLISQQNFRNLDPATIRMWLAQGLRRAQREGEGCRVENGALLRLLDYISGM